MSSHKSTRRFLEPTRDAEDTDFQDELPDDAPFDYDYGGDLDHAPATSNGTYLDGINEGLEPLEEYRDGGYHPIHLGDILEDSVGAFRHQYRVLHKLGHGGFGTVWLCRDLRGVVGYVAVKVMVGDVKSEAVPDLDLARLDGSAPGAKHIAIPLDSFSVEGPNGSHQCIVLPVLGPCVSPDLWLQIKKDSGPGPLLREMARQAAEAMSFLHKNGICHGDFRPSNILVKLSSLNKLSEEEQLSLIGEPKRIQVLMESGEDEICVIDFGESFSISSPPADLGIPENYLAPEVLLELLNDKAIDENSMDDENLDDENKKSPDGKRAAGLNSIGPACDLWALGCTLFEIRQQIPLFYMIFDPDELVAEMVRFFGKLPDEKWSAWAAREDFFDEQGNWLREKEEWSLEVALSKPVEIVESGSRDDDSVAGKKLVTPEAEQKLMADLLYKVFRYEPEKRLSAEDVVAHEWFKL